MCVCMFYSLAQSLILQTDVLHTDYMCIAYQRTSNRKTKFQTHTLSNCTTPGHSLAVYPLYDEINLFWLWLLLQDLLLLQEIHVQYIQDRFLFPPSGNKLQHKPCPHHFSWMPSRSQLYFTRPSPKSELCLLQFNRGQEMLLKSILDRLGQRDESEITIASARC